LNLTAPTIARIARFAPGLAALLRYRRADLPRDVVAGLSVAAVALPVGVAYAQLAGFDPVVGLYSSMLPLLVYAVFGTSRQLIVGPDAATCALIAAAVVPLAAGDPQRHVALSLAMTTLAGVLCVGASFLRLGALADFLSRPILVGFLNGIALHILIGQLGKLAGFAIESQLIVPAAIELVSKADQIHWPTLLTGAASFAVMLVSPRVLPRFPAPLLALVVSGAAVAALGLDARGVAVVGTVPAGLPALALPDLSLGLLDEVAGAAAGVALISFTSLMLTARSFASRNRYEIDADREFAALGAANIAAALSQGFAISGADSRTAIADVSGGRTQLAGIVAALSIALVLLMLTEPLRYVPVAALGAVLVMASLSLLDLRTLRELRRLDRAELALSVLATLGVVWVGAIQAIVVVVVLALLRFIRITSRPSVEVLGEMEGLPGFHSTARHPAARTQAGLLMFRFNGPLVFFNAPYFRQRALSAIAEAGPDLKWFVIDALPLTQVDVTGYYELESLSETLRERGAELVAAGRMSEANAWRDAIGHAHRRVVSRHFPTLRQAARAYLAMREVDQAAAREAAAALEAQAGGPSAPSASAPGN
jgi:high affinity sulfate transporter 1